MSMFRRVGVECVATFREDEVRVLRKVSEEVVGLLTEGFDHTDPVVGRLFPDVYPNDARDSAEDEVLVLNVDEVETGGWFSLQQIEQWLAERPQDFTTAFMALWRLLRGKI